MTVIRDKQTYNYPKPNSTTTSDTESLNLGSAPASDTESLTDETVSPRIRRCRSSAVKVSLLEELSYVKNSCGRKKWRRYQNKCVLQTLDEDVEGSDFVVVMESYKTPFTRLLEDKEAMEYWQHFIQKSEEEQNEIIQSFSKSLQENAGNINREKPGKISSRIKRTLKIRKNLSIEFVKSCEEDLITFFKNKPKDIYTKDFSTSFDRLLLHGIAQYHRLNSVSIFSENEAKKRVEVFNTIEEWIPADCFLFEFIKQLRKIN